MGAKLHAPRLRSATVDRLALIERLRTHSGDVLLVAPPGFGKTTLLGQWHHADPRSMAWVTLDAGDNDPVMLWRAITEAARIVEPGFAHEVDAAFGVPGADVVQAVVPRVLNELESIERDIVIVLEDYHWVRNPVCHDSIRLFLEREPRNVQLVVSSRRDPPLSLGRRRAGADLLELRASDLSFTSEETARFLNDVLGLELSRDALAALQDRTEGWPGGLYLAFLSLRGAPDRERFVREFRGSSRHVVDYLTEVVVTSLEPTARDFLIQTSILERMCGPLCDFVTGRVGSAELLAELERANLFLVPLDDRREWYRYHRLFSDLLQDELRRRLPARVPELHRRASAWLAATGAVDQAIHHAIAAGEFDAASQLVSEHYFMTLEWGGSATVARWLEAFPRSTVVTDARLSIVEAWVMGFLNRRADAELALANALAAPYEGPLPDGASSVEASAALHRAGFPWGDVRRMLDAARRAYELEGRGESMWRVTTHVQLGWALSLAGELEEARPLLEEAAAAAPRTEQWLNAFAARCLLAWINLDEGRDADAEQWARDALEVASAHGISETAPGGWAYTTLGAVVARQGGLDEAAALLGRGVDQLRTGAQLLLLVQGLLALAPVRWALGAQEDARALLGEAAELVRVCADPGILGARLEETARALTPAYRRVAGSDLTERELEVLRLLEKSLSKREIAATLFLSYNTIHSHARSIYRKLDVGSRAGGSGGRTSSASSDADSGPSHPGESPMWVTTRVAPLDRLPIRTTRSQRGALPQRAEQAGAVRAGRASREDAGTLPASTDGMRRIPGGSFLMGSQDFYPEERPVHQVSVGGFWMDEVPVTAGEFRRFVRATGYVTVAERPLDPAQYPDADPDLLVPGSLVFRMAAGPVDLDDYRNWWEYVPGVTWKRPGGKGTTINGRDRHPVVHVACEDAEAYASWVGKELPTEAEWEYAARGGLDGAVFTWGDEHFPNGKAMANTWQGEFPWQNLKVDGFEGTSPVGSFPPNGYGLYDMTGNVWEWTADWYTPRHPEQEESPCCVPKNPRVSSRDSSYDPGQPGGHIPRRVSKGGSHLCAPNYCLRYRPAARQAQQIDSSMAHLGFRCVVRAIANVDQDLGERRKTA